MGGASGTSDAGTVRDTGNGPEAGSPASYSKQIAPLVKANCLSCHGASNPQSGVNLSTYSSLKANAAPANDVVQGGAMPPSGELSAANKQLFQSWLDDGTPNN
jgi:uncharacterized membrane protein